VKKCFKCGRIIEPNYRVIVTKIGSVVKVGYICNKCAKELLEAME
jgi:DNA-directed RNA polymerase subunit RPC12/RpoP